MVILGWILSLFGGGALVYALSLRDTTEYAWNSALGGDTADIDVLFYGSIVALILGVIFLIVGYLNTTKQQNTLPIVYTQQQPTYPMQQQPAYPMQHQYQQNNMPDVSEKMEACSNCNYYNPVNPNSVFCSSCGVKLQPQKPSILCTKCGEPAKPDGLFCAVCGSKLQQNNG